MWPLEEHCPILGFVPTVWPHLEVSHLLTISYSLFERLFGLEVLVRIHVSPPVLFFDVFVTDSAKERAPTPELLGVRPAEVTA